MTTKKREKPRKTRRRRKQNLTEQAKNRIVRKATARFLKSGIQIRDVYGVLEK